MKKMSIYSYLFVLLAAIMMSSVAFVGGGIKAGASAGAGVRANPGIDVGANAGAGVRANPGIDVDANAGIGVGVSAEQSPSTPPDLCQDATIDTIERTQDGSTYVFKGDFYWRVLENGLDTGYPRRIADDWKGLEGELDASLTQTDGKTFFFKRANCWRFTNKQMDSGYPKLISEEFEGIPNMLDAAFTWSENGLPYFYKGGEYWRYDSNESPPVNDQYPLNIIYWHGLPEDGIDAAFVWENGVSYFFKGDQYYRYNDAKDEVEPGYPRSTAEEWFACQN